ncbi:M48 family metallopeptidase [Sphingomonas jatrophae]|uniref:Putative Zn-dependent protease, contains TPR repeats n=1 Tax=Sphingomonas jatrophae TaxID=1166337 RepID=A0A1I6KXL4_9SPHN|nr:M48 family metallopeptidase [Sphingomonas jatrophae]SFR95976.1 Putative Zn-dependent protease, contains TPR repeats [Sphingomonas jatrophae]
MIARAALAAMLALAAPALAAPKAKLAALPPYAGAYQPQTVDERGQWAEADEDERQLRDSAAVVTDPALNAYVRRVLCNAVGDDRCASVRIYILRVPVFNASMSANGTMRVYTGLLLRVRSEAELAAVLGHEFGHFEERHVLAGFRAARTATDLTTWLTLAGGYAAVSTAATSHTIAGNFYAYGRDQERAADRLAFSYTAASRYRPGAAADVWTRVMDENDATSLGRHQRSQRYDKVAFFASHPAPLERTVTLRELARKDGDDGEDATDTYAAALATWRPQFLTDQIKLNDFGGTEYLLAQLAKDGWTPDLLFARGELYRQRGNPRDLVSAAGFYREAIAKGDADPLAQRGLGLALLRSGDAAAGRQALTDYLTLRPDCEDAAMLRSLAAAQ